MCHVACWIGPRRADDRAALEVNAAGRLDCERNDALGVAAHECGEAFTDAQDLEPGQRGADGSGADDAIDARGRTAADQDGQSVRHWSEGTASTGRDGTPHATSFTERECQL